MTLIRVCDGETTGLDDPAELVEIGWTDVRHDGEAWAITSGPHSMLVNPCMPITYPAMAVHHITEDMVRFAKSADEARQIVAHGADILCAHNAAFDARFVRDHGLPWICTFKAARTLWPDLQGHGNGSIRYERGLCPHDDRALPSHRAGPDTWVTAHILLELLKEASVERLIEITENPVLLRTVDFGEHSGKPWSEVPEKYLHWILHTSNMPSDPKKEDVVFTARQEVKRRSSPAPTVEKPREQDAAFDFGSLPRPQSGAERKGGAKATRAAIICGERGFWVFVNEKYDVQVDSAEAAANWLRSECGVASRADLDHDVKRGAIFSDIDHRYRLWLDGFD